MTEYRYDVLGNRIQTILPSGETLNYLYYGSGHLHHINIDGETLSDIERDDLHRPVSRSAGKLHSRFELDPLGRLKQQLAELEPEHHPEVLIGRRYQYDHSGNLIRTEERGRDNKDYAYDPLGRITAAGDERFAFDPAHNISDSGRKVSGTRLTDYNGTRYVYDGLGNLSETHRDNESQYYTYDADNQLIEARTQRNGRPAEVWRYRYDALGRRISKETLNRKTEFIWEGSRLLQEYAPNGVYSYVYTEQGSYEPLAQIFKADGATQSEVLYYHNDQIGIPRELTDAEGNIVWSGEYSGWGKLTNADTACLKKGVHQPFRLQNQYADEETGLHYNFFRYYDPHCGRFTQQDPIGLAGRDNLYMFAPNVQGWRDLLGLARFCTRPLAPLMDLPVVGDVKTDSFLGTNADLAISHTHIFYDNGDNIGYGDKGLFKEENPKIIKKYKCENKHYDDKKMRQAVEKIKNRKDNIFSKKLQYSSDNYSIGTNNCHDFGTEAKKEYDRISSGKVGLRDLIIK